MFLYDSRNLILYAVLFGQAFHTLDEAEKRAAWRKSPHRTAAMLRALRKEKRKYPRCDVLFDAEKPTCTIIVENHVVAVIHSNGTVRQYEA